MITRLVIPFGTSFRQERKMIKKELNDIYHKEIPGAMRWGIIPLSKLNKRQLQAIIYLLMEGKE